MDVGYYLESDVGAFSVTGVVVARNGCDPRDAPVSRRPALRSSMGRLEAAAGGTMTQMTAESVLIAGLPPAASSPHDSCLPRLLLLL
jgi:hypothetical protein